MRSTPGKARSLRWRDRIAGLGVAAVAGLIVATPAYPQQLNQLACQGQIYGLQAVITGQRLYRPYNALGDGEVAFDGRIQAGGITGTIRYGGYTNAAFDGFIQSTAGSVQISVLDNTGGRMIIYEGTPRLGAPEQIGIFVCQWR